MIRAERVNNRPSFWMMRWSRSAARFLSARLYGQPSRCGNTTDVSTTEPWINCHIQPPLIHSTGNQTKSNSRLFYTGKDLWSYATVPSLLLLQLTSLLPLPLSEADVYFSSITPGYDSSLTVSQRLTFQNWRASSFSAMTFCTQRKNSLSNWTINSNF